MEVMTAPPQERTIEDTAGVRGHTHAFALMKAGPDGGDQHITWNPDDPASVKVAEDTFKKMVVGGHYNAYKVTTAPRRVGEPITEFDPEMGRLMMGAPSDDEIEDREGFLDRVKSRVRPKEKVIAAPAMAGG